MKKKVIKKCMECGRKIVNKEKEGYLVVRRRCKNCKLRYEGVLDFK